jgi:hypothetical protein
MPKLPNTRVHITRALCVMQTVHDGSKEAFIGVTSPPIHPLLPQKVDALRIVQCLKQPTNAHRTRRRDASAFNRHRPVNGSSNGFLSIQSRDEDRLSCSFWRNGVGSRRSRPARREKPLATQEGVTWVSRKLFPDGSSCSRNESGILLADDGQAFRN